MLKDLLPDTEDYMTYEGSTTYPGCTESVTWIVMNKPIYMSRYSSRQFRELIPVRQLNTVATAFIFVSPR